DVATLPGWVSWDPDQKPQIYQYIIDAYAEFNKAFNGFPPTTEIAFYKFSYEKTPAGNIIMRKDVAAMFGVSDLLVFSPVTEDNALPFARSVSPGNYTGAPADTVKFHGDPDAAPLVKPTERESAMRFIFHELGHGLQAAAMAPPGALPGETPDSNMGRDYGIEIGRPPLKENELYDAGIESVYSTIQKGLVPADEFKISVKDWDDSKWIEQPISEYMVTGGLGEDFGEAVMTFVANPALLKSRSPRRYNFINTRRTRWQSRFAATHIPSTTTNPAASQPTSPVTAPPIKNGGLSDQELNRIALLLHKAMAGWGTDEDSIYSALSGRTQEQVDAIALTYKSMYGHFLLDDLKDELNDSEMRHLAIFSPTATDRGNNAAAKQARAELIAVQLRDAMSGLGTNVEAIMAALTGRSESEREEIKKAYNRLTNHELEADLTGELSGSDLQRALKLLNEGILMPEEESFWSKLWGGIKSVAGTVWRGIKAFAGWTWDALKSAGAWLWDLITWLPQRIWGLIKHVASGIADIAVWLWDLIQVIKGDKSLSEWIVDGLLGGVFWALKLVAKVADLFGVGEVWTLVWNVIKFNTRTLNETEILEAKKVFGDSVSYWQVRIDEKSLLSKMSLALNNLIKKRNDDGMGITTAHTINFNRKINATPGNEDMRWLIHELTHVSQYTQLGLQYIGQALHAQMFGTGYDYNGGAGLVRKNLGDFNREQQASIISDYYCSVLYYSTGSCEHIYPWAGSYIADYTRLRNQALRGQF
ncbi:MAG: annexin, partial [Chitinophagaceae bacterium]